MAPEVTGALMIGGRYLVCLLGPLIPAVLIFKLFPDSKVSVQGPLQGLSVKSGGAFAAYLVTFLIALPMTSGISDLRKSVLTPVWTVKANIMIIDKNGDELPVRHFSEDLTATITPKLLRVGDKLSLTVPASGKDLPVVLLEIPGFGGETLDLNGGKHEVDRNDDAKTLTVKDQVIIREQRQ